MTHHASRARTLADEIRELTGQNAAKCYQCGKCSAGCPMAEETTLRPHDILRQIQHDLREQLLGSDQIWLCLTCELCTARCPNGVDPARIIDALRELVMRDPERLPPRAMRAFHKSFLKQIRRSGRIFEFGLIAGFKLRSGKLFADVGQMPAVLRRGKLALMPHRIAGVEDVRRIFRACQAEAEAAGEPEAEVHE